MLLCSNVIYKKLIESARKTYRIKLRRGQGVIKLWNYEYTEKCLESIESLHAIFLLSEIVLFIAQRNEKWAILSNYLFNWQWIIHHVKN